MNLRLKFKYIKNCCYLSKLNLYKLRGNSKIESGAYLNQTHFQLFAKYIMLLNKLQKIDTMKYDPIIVLWWCNINVVHANWKYIIYDTYYKQIYIIWFCSFEISNWHIILSKEWYKKINYRVCQLNMRKTDTGSSMQICRHLL